MEQLEGRVAVVTGAASGIGKAMAERFAAEGMKLALADVEQAPLDATVAELAGRGTEAIGVRTDVSEWGDVVALRDAALDAFGAVHLVCNNAGVGGGGSLWDIELDRWRWVIGVDLWGVIHGVKAFVPLLVQQGEGHVVNTSSMAGLSSPAFMGPYNVAKHGVVTLSETLFAELAMAAPGVGVSVVCPGWVQTNIDTSDRNYPGGRPEPADPEAAAAVREVTAGLIAGGIAPEEVADLVCDAVRDRTFYVLTHPAWKPMIKRRVDAILDGTDPPVGHLTE